MKAFVDYNDYEVVGTYEDAGKSGQFIEGRLEFNCRIDDIKSYKDGVSFALIFELSRFGGNAVDVFSTLQVMQEKINSKVNTAIRDAELADFEDKVKLIKRICDKNESRLYRNNC